MRLLWIAIGVLLTMAHNIYQPQAYLDPAPCPCVSYTSEKAECPDGDGCLDELQETTGTIKVTTKSLYARLAEAVVYVVEVPGKEFQPPRENPVQDQKNLVFVPHAQGVLVGSAIDFPNSDTVRHNVYSTPDSAQVFNLGTYPPEEVKQVTFDKLGVVSLRCNVHAEMSAYLVVSQNPYFATTDRRTQQAIIRNVPPGTYKVSFFHERLEPKELEVTVEAGEEAVVEFTDLKRR